MLGNLHGVSTRYFINIVKLTIGLVLPVEAVVYQNASIGELGRLTAPIPRDFDPSCRNERNSNLQ